MPLLVRKNDRREVRRAHRFTCQVVRERDFRLVATRAIDVSPDGMLVLFDGPFGAEGSRGSDAARGTGAPEDEPLAPGESVIVSFKATNLGLWFDTDATVARVIRGRRPGDKGRGVALRFGSLDGVKRLILRGHLRRVPPPVPRRTQRIDWSATVRSVSR
jgi:hypothetical protein